MINLLPPSRSRAFRRSYFIRLATVGFMLLTGLVVIHGVLLLPSYLYASAEVRAEQADLASTEASTPGNVSSAEAELTTLKSDASYLGRLGAAPSASGAVRAALSVPHPGISIVSITYTPPGPSSPASAKVVLTGTAATREELRTYDLALSGVPFISSVDLPISAYAQESNIAFSVTLTGTLQPLP